MMSVIGTGSGRPPYWNRFWP